MNKLVKGSIAGAAGIALLLGGAGSLAFWNDAAGLGAASGEISTGTLSVAADATAPAGAWTTSAVALWVPGDSNTYTETFTVEAAGDNLVFDLSTNIADIISPSSVDVFDELDVTSSFAITKTAGTGTGAIASPTGLTAGTYTVVATITVDWDIDADGNGVGNQADQNKSAAIDLSDVQVIVTQQH